MFTSSTRDRKRVSFQKFVTQTRSRLKKSRNQLNREIKTFKLVSK